MSPKSRERSRVLAAKYRAEMPLNELREARELTQVHLAELLKVNQSGCFENGEAHRHVCEHTAPHHQSDGWGTEDYRNFPGRVIEINQFRDARKAATAGR